MLESGKESDARRMCAQLIHNDKQLDRARLLNYTYGELAQHVEDGMMDKEFADLIKDIKTRPIQENTTTVDEIINRKKVKAVISEIPDHEARYRMILSA